MKNVFILLALLILCLGSCKTTKPAASKGVDTTLAPSSAQENEQTPVSFSDPSTWILGYFKPERLTQPPYNSWYLKGFDEYQINSEALNKLLDINKDNVTIKIVMGTWCSDSRREVPGLMRILDLWKFPLSKVVLIGVDNSKNSSVEEYKSLNIERVPTFIIYKNNIEAGRIIENPVTSLEQDMVNILNRNE